MGSRLLRAVWIGGVLAGVAVLALTLILGLSRLSDFEPPEVTLHEVSFGHAGNVLHGTLYDAPGNGPVVLFVHGDAAQDRTSGGGYLPLVNALTDAGLSVFSWDKPGVGQSDGNWLDQSMQDRAGEVAGALAALRTLPVTQGRKLGLLGFSQAGWVLPRVPALTGDATFLILIGPAISWQEQAGYYSARRLEREGRSAAEIADRLQSDQARDRALFAASMTYQDYVDLERRAGKVEADLMTEARFGFVRRNFPEDARDHLAGLTLPILVLSGAEDLNVDPQQTIAVYTATLAHANPQNRFHLVPGATHSLLKADRFNYQLPDQWPVGAKARFLLLGRDAYVPGVLAMVSEWISALPEVSGTP